MGASVTVKTAAHKDKRGDRSEQSSAQGPEPGGADLDPMRRAPAGVPLYLHAAGDGAPPVQPKAVPGAGMPLYLGGSAGGAPPVQPKAVPGAGMPLYLGGSAAAAPAVQREAAPQVELPLFLRGSAERALPIQPKLAIGRSGDAFEQEADRVAEAVVRPIRPPDEEELQGAGAASRTAPAQGGPAANGDQVVQKKPSAARRPAPVPAQITAPDSGAPLASDVRTRVEPLLGVDLSHVRVHTAPSARSLARDLGARAFTHRNHIWLGPGQSSDDMALMAHEATHVAQQTAESSATDTIQRVAEAGADDGEQVRRRMQRRIDEAVGRSSQGGGGQAADAAPAAQGPTPGEARGGRSGTRPAADSRATSASRSVDRAAVQSRRGELQPEARPNVDRAAEQRPQVEQAARETQQAVERPPEQAAGAEGQAAAAGAAGGKGGGAGGEGQGASAAAAQAAGVADQAFAAAENQAPPGEPMEITPPDPVAPVDAGGEPLPSDPGAEERVFALAGEAQRMREQGTTLRAHAAEERANAQILSGNVQLVDEAIGRSEANVGTAQGHMATRRELVGRAQAALTVSEQKAATVAAGAPGGVSRAGAERERSGPMASGARDLASENSANTPDDPEAAQNAQEQGAHMNSVGSDAATVDNTIGDVHTAASTLVEDAARATETNTQTRGKVEATEEALTQADESLAQMGEQNAGARGNLDGMREGPATIAEGAAQLDAQGEALIQSSFDLEGQLQNAQRSHASGMARVPAVVEPEAPEEAAAAPAPLEASPPPEAEAPAPAPAAEPEASPAAESEAPAAEPATAAAESDAAPAAQEEAAAPAAQPAPEQAESSSGEDVVVQRQTDPGAPAAQPAAPPPIDIGRGLPSWLSGQEAPNERQREEAEAAEQRRRQRDLDEIENAAREAGGFENLSSGDRARLALRQTGRNLFGGLGGISWPGLGGIGRGAGRLALALIDPRAPLMGVISGINTIANGVANFVRQPSWGGALTLAASIATGITIILGSITALAGVIAALMTAITIVSLGIAAPITGPIIAFCATVMTTVGGWTFWAGLIAAGLNALVFVKDLYLAATAQTADALMGHADAMTTDGRAVGTSLLQAGMGRLAQVGGRSMQSAISRAGGGVRFAAGMGARALPARVVRGVRFSGGVRAYGRSVASGMRTGLQTRAAAAGGYSGLARQTLGRWGTGLRNAGRGIARELRSGGTRTVTGRQGLSRDFLLGEGIPRGAGGFRGIGTTWRGMVGASRTTRGVVTIEHGLTFAGRSDLHGAVRDVEQLGRQNRVEGFDDWVRGARSETPEGMVRHTSELLDARRLHGEIAGDPTRLIRIGQDRATAGKSFDNSVEQRTGSGAPTVERRVEVETNMGNVAGSNSFHSGVAHGASKIGPLPAPGTALPAGATREATVVVNWPPQPIPTGGVSRGGGQATQAIAADGSLTLQLPDGSTRALTNRVPGGGPPQPRNVFDDLLQDLRTNKMQNPAVNYLDAVNIVDNQGNLLARYTNTGNPLVGNANWTR